MASAYRKGLSVDPRLARSPHSVDERRTGAGPGVADVGEYLAGCVVQDERCGIAHAAVRELRELALQRFLHHGLQRRVESGLNPSCILGEQFACELRGKRPPPLEPRRLGQIGRGERLVHRAWRCSRELAGAFRHHWRLRVRAAQQRRQEGGFACIEAGGVLPEQTAGGGTDPDQLAAEGGEIEVGLEDAALGPGLLELACGPDLIPLLRDGAPLTRGLELRFQHRRHLHRERARAARCAAHDGVHRGIAQGPPIHAGVLEEPLVLGAQHRFDECRGHARERYPRKPSHPLVHAQLVDHLAVPIEQDRLARQVGALHVLERGDRRRGRRRHDQERRRDRGAPAHGATVSVALGCSANISGAYKASTRVGGSENVPGLLRRSVYSTVHLPFGTSR